MVNQEKVRLMTRAELYRQQEKRGAIQINRYSKGAYVSMRVVKSLIMATIGVVVVVAMWAVYEGEALLAINDFKVFLDLFKRIGVLYAAVFVIAALVSWRTYSRIYVSSRSSVKKYYNVLRKINHINEKEKRKLTGQLPPLRKEGEA